MCTDRMPKPRDEAAQHRGDLQRGPPGTPRLDAGTGPMAEQAPAPTEHLTAAVAASKSVFFWQSGSLVMAWGCVPGSLPPPAALLSHSPGASPRRAGSHLNVGAGRGAGMCEFWVFLLLA